MTKPAAPRLLSAALVSALVGLAGCHISVSSGSSSRSPGSTAKPAKKSPSQARPTSTTSKPVSKSAKAAPSKPAASKSASNEPAPAKEANPGPTRDESGKKDDKGPQRTDPDQEPQRIKPKAENDGPQRRLGTRTHGTTKTEPEETERPSSFTPR